MAPSHVPLHAVALSAERELLRNAFFPLGHRVLALGPREGASFPAVSGLTFASPYEERLAFADATFDHVLVRDTVRLLDAPTRTLAEIRRVLRPGGRLDVLEPSLRNPLVAAGALRGIVDRGALDASELERLVGRSFVLVETSRHQAMPLHLAVLREGSSAVAVRAVAAAEKALDLLVPRALWAFVHVRARRPQ